eukprot:scaffold73321_cov36-Tisochrysis_lutea.AAC.1
MLLPSSVFRRRLEPHQPPPLDLRTRPSALPRLTLSIPPRGPTPRPLSRLPLLTLPSPTFALPLFRPPR